MIFLLLCLFVLADLPNWLEFVNDYNPITHITIPGSYLSGTDDFYISSPYYCAQNIPINQQLMIGVRFFDIELRDLYDNIHAVYYDKYNLLYSHYNYNKIQSIFINFLNKYPTEFIIIKISYDGELMNILTNNIRDFSEYYYQKNDIPIVMNLRKKIYILQDYSNNSAIYYNYSNVQGYKNVLIDNCNYTSIKRQLESIEKSISDSVNKQTKIMYLTFGVGYPIYEKLCGLSVHCFCNISYTSKIFNSKLEKLINNINYNSLGIIALAKINSNSTLAIVFKNNLEIYQKL